MTYVGFRSCGINKHHFSLFSSPLSSFFFSCPLLSRETSWEEQSTAATWRWRQPRLFVILLLLPFRERGVIAIATRTRTRSQSDRLSFLVGDHVDQGATLSRKPFVDIAYFGNCPTEGFSPEKHGIPSSAVNVRRLEPNIDFLFTVSSQMRSTALTFLDKPRIKIGLIGTGNSNLFNAETSPISRRSFFRQTN